MVARIRSKFCQYLGSDVGPLWSQGLEATSVSIRCFGRDWNRRESEEKALLGKVAGGCGWGCTRRLVFVGPRCGAIMVARIRSKFCQYLGSDVGPLWSQGLEATSVSIRCFGRDWNRRESEEKALLGKVAGGCGWECTRWKTVQP